MKKTSRLLMLILAAGLMVACSKEKDAPQPEPEKVYVCQDNRFTGPNCDQQKKPKKIWVTKVILSSFRELKYGNLTWDDCCDYGDYRADVVIRFYEGTPRPGSFQFGLPIVWDANHNQQYVYLQDNLNQFPYEISLSTDYTIDIMDYDLGGEEMIAQLYFTSYTNTNGFPSIIEKNTSNGHVKIYLDYEF